MTRFVLVLAVFTLAPLPLAAAPRAPDAKTEKPAQDKVADALKGSLDTLIKLIDKVVKDVPQYEAPEVLDNGDIIIRRKQKADPPAKASPGHTALGKKV